MQAIRQTRLSVRQRHNAAAARENRRLALKLVLGVILSFTFIYTVFFFGEDRVYIDPATPAVVAESPDSIETLAHSLRAESRINKIEAALE